MSQMLPRYTALPTSERCSAKDDGDHEHAETAIRTRSSQQVITWLLLLLGVSNVMLLIVVFRSSLQGEKNVSKYTGLDHAHRISRPAYTSTAYNSLNETEANDAWESIRSGQGVVAVSSEWALQRQLPDTMEHPEDPSKRVYLIEAYHAIHCVKSLRENYMALLEGKNLGWEAHHTAHCFDALRQHIMCNADDTLLYTFGHRQAGVEQARQCKNWDSLRQWAASHSACYITEPAEGKSNWGECGDGSDGLV